jgi:hypothetical protein
VNTALYKPSQHFDGRLMDEEKGKNSGQEVGVKSSQKVARTRGNVARNRQTNLQLRRRSVLILGDFK